MHYFSNTATLQKERKKKKKKEKKKKKKKWRTSLRSLCSLATFYLFIP